MESIALRQGVKMLKMFLLFHFVEGKKWPVVKTYTSSRGIENKFTAWSWTTKEIRMQSNRTIEKTHMDEYRECIKYLMWKVFMNSVSWIPSSRNRSRWHCCKMDPLCMKMKIIAPWICCCLLRSPTSLLLVHHKNFHYTTPLSHTERSLQEFDQTGLRRRVRE